MRTISREWMRGEHVEGTDNRKKQEGVDNCSHREGGRRLEEKHQEWRGKERGQQDQVLIKEVRKF
jgi:hypothetical protein